MMTYVVHICERLRDGFEEFAKLFSSKESAIAWINKGRFAQDNHEFRLFELGKEIPIEQEAVKIRQPIKVEKRYKLKGVKP